MKILARSRQLDGKKINTTLIATIGPSSDSKETIKQLLAAGMGVARFNIAHGSLESHERALKNLREVLAETQSLCATLVSLQGFNLRTGSTENDAVIQLVARQLFTWRCAPGDARLLTTERSGYINCAYLPAAVKPGMILRVDDIVPFEIYDVVGSTLVCVVLVDAEIGSNQRVSCTSAVFPEKFLDTLVERDKADLAWANKNGIDFITYSASSVIESRLPFQKNFIKRIDSGLTLAETLTEQVVAASEMSFGLQRTVDVAIAAGQLVSTDVAVAAAASGAPDKAFALRRSPSFATTPSKLRNSNSNNPSPINQSLSDVSTDSFASSGALHELMKQAEMPESTMATMTTTASGARRSSAVMQTRYAGLVFMRNRLGGDVASECIPAAQRALSRHAAQFGPPVIVSSELLESMMRNNKPSRAEATDVANIVFEAAHAIQLTGETAVGNYPVLALRLLGDICREAERHVDYRAEYIELRKNIRPPIDEHSSLASTAALCVWDVQARLVVLLKPTPTLSTAIAAYRQAHIVHVTEKEDEARAAMLLRGRTMIVVEDCNSVVIDELLGLAREITGVNEGDYAVVVDCRNQADEITIRHIPCIPESRNSNKI